MFVLFDQKIDPAAVLAKLALTADGKPWSVRPLDATELGQLAKSPRWDHKQLASLVEAAKKNEQDGRWLAFRPAQDLPKDAQIRVELAAGTPSAEGPNLTKEAQSFDFRTYPPLRIEEARCGSCTPTDGFYLEFNNPLDGEKFEDSWVSADGVGDLKVNHSARMISLTGKAKARTSYEVKLSGKIIDSFGQTLGQDDTRPWRVGDARPTFYGPSGMVVLDPAAKKQTLDFFSTNYDSLKVRLYKVAPSDFDTYGFYLRNQWNKDNPPPPPGALVFDQLVKTTAGQNELVETSIDLSPALSRAGLGHAVAIVEPHPWTQPYGPPRMIAWVQATKLAVDAHVDAGTLRAFATELDTGKPAGGIALELRPAGTRQQTDDQGTATLALSAGGAKGAHYLVARRGDDVAFVAEHGNGYEYGSWFRRDQPTTLAWYVIDDRKMYRPGEEVTLKGWLRTIDTGLGGDVGGVAGSVSSIKYRATDSRGNKIAEGALPVTAVGGFDVKLTLPKTPNLGTARLWLEAQGRPGGGNVHTHTFQIEEFRRPEFEVSAQTSQGPFLVGGGGDVTVNAKYYTGAPLPAAPVQWQVTASQTNFTPPNRDGYIFGAWRPWWGTPYRPSRARPLARGRHGIVAPDGSLEQRSWSHAGKTDGAGEHTLHFDFLSVKPAMPMSVMATATVTDVNRQAWSASSALVVHPSQLYVGLKTKRPFVQKGAPFELEVIGVDVDGKRRSTRRSRSRRSASTGSTSTASTRPRRSIRRPARWSRPRTRGRAASRPGRAARTR